jgi:CheY-like chemotaxis protein
MPRTLLIVEDVETCASTLEIMFSAMENLHVEFARDGEQALRMLDAGIPDLAAIVTDLEMRGMDGYEMLRRVRENPRHASVPIMVITGTSDVDARARVTKLGADAFYSKPFSPVIIREKMRQLLYRDQSNVETES